MITVTIKLMNGETEERQISDVLHRLWGELAEEFEDRMAILRDIEMESER